MNTEHGFTLVELMITLAIAAILLTVGVPSFNDFIMDGRLVSQANDFIADLNLARSTAVKYQRNASICVSTSYNTATPACTNGTDWSNGWIVWVDKDRDSTVDASEVVKVREPFNEAATFTSTTTNQITYDSRGFVNMAETFSLCDDRDDETGRQITISASGRPNISQKTDC